MTNEIINLDGWGKCLKLSNDVVELTTTLDLGPRIIGFNLIGGENIFNPIGKVDPIVTDFGDFYTYGGHRLWHAPEGKPRSYVTDNDPIKYELTETGAIFYYNYEKETGMDKNFEIILGEDASLYVRHTLTNRNIWPLKCACWGLTIMSPGGRFIMPQEPFIPNTKKLLPARPLVLWNYTNMADPRWTWGRRFVTLKNDANILIPQKVGFMDKLGWACYEKEGTVFMKNFNFYEDAEYVDYGCNVETFTNGTFHEFETVGPIKNLNQGESAIYTEKWTLFANVQLPEDEDGMADILFNLADKAKKAFVKDILTDN
ncbi:MAG: hypothetical protein IJS60_05705 [Abditibacteriota bacterium]|nr:hypothetical protein [Abditibacteriota bacterium]